MVEKGKMKINSCLVKAGAEVLGYDFVEPTIASPKETSMS